MGLRSIDLLGQIPLSTRALLVVIGVQQAKHGVLRALGTKMLDSVPYGCGSNFKQEGLRRFWSMFQLTRVPFW